MYSWLQNPFKFAVIQSQVFVSGSFAKTLGNGPHKFSKIKNEILLIDLSVINSRYLFSKLLSLPLYIPETLTSHLGKVFGQLFKSAPVTLLYTYVKYKNVFRHFPLIGFSFPERILF